MLIYDIVSPEQNREIKSRKHLKMARKLVFQKGAPFLLTLLLIFQIIAGAFLPFRISPTPPFVKLQETMAAGENWYDANWTRRKAITVTENSGSTLTNYQVKITVAYDSDMQADFDDIMFTDENGSTLIDHWLESKTDSTTADFWVEVPSIPASGTATIYIYYGNQSAASASNGTATFEFFDDFSSGSLSGWEQTTLYNNFAVISTDWSSGNDIYSVKILVNILDMPGITRAMSVTNVRAMIDYNITSISTAASLYTEPTGQVISDYTVKTVYNWESSTITASTPYELSFRHEPQGPNPAMIAYIDRVRVRKYASPEPSVGALGGEEEYPLPYAPTSPYCEGATNPTNVSDTTPEFSAIYNDPNTGDIANKYRIQVNAKSDFTGASMWDSGTAGASMTNCAEGTRCQDVSYAGAALSLDGSGYFWRIKFWDDEGYEGAWSDTQSFTMIFSLPIAPTSPYCEGATNPTNVSDTTPEFSAIYNDPNTGDIANKYRIQVNAKSDFTGTSMWDSGAAGTSMTNCAEGIRCQDISYAGAALLLDGSGYFWQIKFWDIGGNEGAWSATQSFVMRASNWLSSWTYRTPIRIAEKSGSDLTNYPILVTIDTQSLISAGKLQSGCQDIRFTDRNGSTTIDYWIESGCNTASTEIWIKIPSLLTLTAKNIYFYYGNTSASSESDDADAIFGYDGTDTYTYLKQISSFYWEGRDSTTDLADGDDVCSEIQTLQFDAHFYGINATSYIVSSNGILDMEAICREYLDDYDDFQNSKTISFHDDLRTDTAGGVVDEAGIYRDSFIDKERITYEVTQYGDPDTSVKFQFILFPSGKIIYSVNSATNLENFFVDYPDWSIAGISKGDSLNYHDITLEIATDKTWIFYLRKYASPEPTASFGSEEKFSIRGGFFPQDSNRYSGNRQNLPSSVLSFLIEQRRTKREFLNLIWKKEPRPLELIQKARTSRQQNPLFLLRRILK